MLGESLKSSAVEIELVDEAPGRTSHIVMPVRILHRICHKQLVSNQGDIEWGIAAFEVRIGEGVLRQVSYAGKRRVIHLDSAGAEVCRVQEKLSCAVLGNSQSFVNGSVGCVRSGGVVHCDDGVSSRLCRIKAWRIHSRIPAENCSIFGRKQENCRSAYWIPISVNAGNFESTGGASIDVEDESGRRT